jgi:large subunit ribosomal protein L29
MKLRDTKKKYREMTDLELKDKLRETTEELFNIRFQLATGHLEDFTKIKQNKKLIARLKTIMREKQLGITK